MFWLNFEQNTTKLYGQGCKVKRQLINTIYFIFIFSIRLPIYCYIWNQLRIQTFIKLQLYIQIRTQCWITFLIQSQTFIHYNVYFDKEGRSQPLKHFQRWVVRYNWKRLGLLYSKYSFTLTGNISKVFFKATSGAFFFLPPYICYHECIVF